METLVNRKKAYDIIDKSVYGVMSLFDKDNSIYSVPLNFVRINDDIYFHCGKKGKKIDLLKENNKVSFLFVGDVNLVPERFTTVYESLMFNTIIEFVENNDEKIKALTKLCEKFAPENKTIDSCISKSLDVTVICKAKLCDMSLKVKTIDDDNKIKKYIKTV